ncbi:MAG TPA: 30S ribosomal protein S6 [Kiritimatiellia bacterium]|nr:30S ribosomal protein S6 [Kiritimatiellia bacterium]HRZ12998.1 30S ribosomal protein S6 [Kiritimatiellia bacterium]HSA18392.1 30S ribosomal protein S6 [Kiritimatiellia bacterium]
MKKYEIMFIFPEALKDEALAAALTKAQEEIKRVGGEIENVTQLGKRGFARAMKKKEAGYYVLAVVRLPADQIAPLQAKYRLDEGIFRVQVVEAPASGSSKITVPGEYGERSDRSDRGERDGQP